MLRLASKAGEALSGTYEKVPTDLPFSRVSLTTTPSLLEIGRNDVAASVLTTAAKVFYDILLSHTRALLI